MAKPKGVYLIQEKGCLNPYSGAFQHISMGVKHLSNSFYLDVFLNTKKITLTAYKKNTSQSPKNKSSKTKPTKGVVYGTVKDLHLFFSHLLKIFDLIKLLKKEKPAFVYERVSYLNFSGLIACKYLGIPHFYEANGLQFDSRKKYYKSGVSKVAKRLEKTAYSLSSHTFFVGTYGDYWKIKKRNWTNVENGIEAEAILPPKHQESASNPVDVCFVGRYMEHQRLDVFVNALKKTKSKSKLRINLIGTGLEPIEQDIKALGIEVINHGFIEREKIITLLSGFHIAVIAGSPEFQSCMKLFDYGAAGCAVIAPNIHNLKYWFSKELLFFDGSSLDFSKKLEDLVTSLKEQHLYSELLRDRVADNFTWETIFFSKTKTIQSKM